jgi:hypothetical protein
MNTRFGVGGVTQLHLKRLHIKIWYETMYLIPYNILYKIHMYIKHIYNIIFHVIFKSYTHI